MGGHGGLNILPQKSWNVYNFENREKVRRDEEAAAKEEQLKQEQSRRRDAEFRLEKLREASRAKRKHLPTLESPEQIREAAHSDPPDALPANDDNHINLFKGWDVFQMEGEVKERKPKDEARPVEKRRRKEEQNVKAVLPEDEKYRMGYGVAGKDVKKPWYLSTSFMAEEEIRPAPKRSPERNGEITKKKRSLQELREERLKREQQERERAQKLLSLGSNESKGKPDVSVCKRAPFYNSTYQGRR